MEFLNQYQAILNSPIGMLGIKTDAHSLLRIHFLDHETPTIPPKNSIAEQAIIEINAYFANPHHSFTIPIQLTNSEFQQQALKILQTIPAGQTRTYGEIAKQLHTAPRAIGVACRLNPLPLIFPCHRIVASNGLGGFNGFSNGLFPNKKIWLIQHEQKS